jgi:tetratricopeptide (TPR) repeat protein
VAYGSLLQERRRALHAGIVEALERLAPDRLAEQVERLTHHALRGEVWDKALVYCRQAGEKAMMRSAYREAVGSFEQALRVLPHLPDHRDMREQAIDLRFALRTALQASGDLGRILTVLREAEALAAALDDPRRLGQVSIFMNQHYFITGDPDQAIASCQRALAMVSGDVGLHAVANNYLGMAYHTQGEYQQAIAYCRRTVAALDDALRRERFGQVILPTVASRTFLAWSLAEMGQFAEGLAIAEEGRRVAEAVGLPGSLMFAYFGAGLPSLRQGDLAQALPRLERAVGLCQEADLPLWFPWVAWALGSAYVLSKRVTDAQVLLEQAVEQSASMGRWAYHALFVATLGEALLRAGHLVEARLRAEKALVFARAHKERGHEAWALRVLGEIAAQRDPLVSDEAATYYQQALTLADALGMRPLVAHCHYGLGSLYAKISRWDAARGELSAAIELYRAMEMAFWLPQAQATVAEMEGR